MWSRVIVFSFFFSTAVAPNPLLTTSLNTVDPTAAFELDPETGIPIDSTSGLPINHVTCLGNPNFDLPRFRDWDPNRSSMQDICVKLVAGGTGVYHRSLGGECNARAAYSYRYRQPLIFDRSYMLRRYDSLYNPRLIHHCQLRCFCSRDVEDLSVKPWEMVDQEYYGVRPSIYRLLHSFTAYQISIDILDDFLYSSPPPGYRCHRALQLLPVLPAREWLSRFCPDVPKWKQIRDRDRPFITYEQVKNIRPRSRSWGFDRYGSIVFDPINNITCNNFPPPFELDIPNYFRESETLQQICATSLLGGSRYVIFPFA